MKKQLKIEIVKRIRMCRESLGYSREALAEKADLSNSFLGTIELGSGSFTAESLIKLCSALGVSADYILFGRNTTDNLSTIHAMLSALEPEYIPYVEQMLNLYIKSLHHSKNK